MSVNSPRDAIASMEPINIFESPTTAIEDRVSAAASSALLQNDASLMSYAPLPHIEATSSSQMTCLSPLSDDDLPITLLLAQARAEGVIEDEAPAAASSALSPNSALPSIEEDDFLSIFSRLAEESVLPHFDQFSGLPLGSALSNPPQFQHCWQTPCMPGETNTLSIPVQNAAPLHTIPKNNNIGRTWRKEELKVLDDCLTFDDALSAPLLQGRNYRSIRKQWLKKHPEDKKAPLWTLQEDDILRSYTSLREAQNAPELRGRAASAITARWQHLNQLAKAVNAALLQNSIFPSMEEDNSLPIILSGFDEDSIAEVSLTPSPHAMATSSSQQSCLPLLYKDGVWTAASAGLSQNDSALPSIEEEDSLPILSRFDEDLIAKMLSAPVIPHATASSSLQTPRLSPLAHISHEVGEEELPVPFDQIVDKAQTVLQRQCLEDIDSASLSLAPQTRRLEGHMTSASTPFGDTQSVFIPRKRSKPSHEESAPEGESIDSLPSLFEDALSNQHHWQTSSIPGETNTQSTPVQNTAPLTKTPRLWRLWSKEELKELDDCPTLKDALNAPLLQGRTPASISSQWAKKHPELKTLIDWTPQEKDILRSYTSPEEVVKDSRLKHRTKIAILDKWWKVLPPENKKIKPWTGEEEDILRTYKRCKDATKDPRLQHRTKKAIRNRWYFLIEKTRESLKN